MKIKIPFYLGLGSRYSYLAATQMDKIADELDCEFEWLPVSTSDLIKRFNQGTTPFEGAPPSGQYDFSFRQADAEAWASYYGVPYREPTPPRSCPPEFAKACWIAEEHGKFHDMIWHIMRAVFVDSKVVNTETLVALSDEIGLAGGEVVARFDDPMIIARYEATMARALSDQVFGVPACVVSGTVLWGNDRLPLVKHAIEKMQQNS